ncbi:hypothetical protein ACOME3_004942 [Neoechinorhynchus agilis]
MGQHLSLLYLANDIIQNSFRRGSEFSKPFSIVIVGALEKIVSFSDEETLNGTERMLQIWTDRHIYEDELMNKFWQVILDADYKQNSDQLSADIAKAMDEFECSSEFTTSVDVLVDQLQEMENCPSCDERVQKITKSAHFELQSDEVYNAVGMYESSGTETTRRLFTESKDIVNRYSALLHDELTKRKNIGRYIHSLIEEHQLILDQDANRIRGLKKELDYLVTTKTKVTECVKEIDEKRYHKSIPKN